MRGSGFLLAIGLVLPVGCGSKSDTRPAASASAAGQGASAPGGATSAAAPGRFTSEVVAVDAKEGRIVLRNASASGGGASAWEKSIPVVEGARGQLSTLKAGDQVVVACQPTGSQTAATPARPRDIGPAGGNDGVGPIAPDSDDLRTCTAVVSLIPVASSAGR
jgi:hypothetical protein